jgi:hypothetical protein
VSEDPLLVSQLVPDSASASSASHWRSLDPSAAKVFPGTLNPLVDRIANRDHSQRGRKESTTFLRHQRVDNPDSESATGVDVGFGVRANPT